jgi:cell migration-inducing and hyaluronan-binding protein
LLSRSGKQFTLAGETNVRAGTQIKVTTERPTVSLNLRELDNGSWVLFELPGFNTAAAGTPQPSLDALRAASATSYYKANDALWVKIVSTGDAGRGAPGGAPGVQVSR